MQSLESMFKHDLQGSPMIDADMAFQPHSEPKRDYKLELQQKNRKQGFVPFKEDSID
jgi:hypothetical protein